MYVEAPRLTSHQSSFSADVMLVWSHGCFVHERAEMKEGVSNTTHVITQEIISVMPSIWIDVGHGAFDIYRHGC